MGLKTDANKKAIDFNNLICGYCYDGQWYLEYSKKRKIMPEVYYCVCGNQYWTIYGMKIVCKNCGCTFNLDCIMPAKEFNEKRRSIQIQEI